MPNTEIREVNGIKVGFNLDTNSYYQIGDDKYDPNYNDNVKKRSTPSLPVILSASIEGQNGVTFDAPEVEYSKNPEFQPVLEYQWMEGTAPAYVDDEIKGATNSTYTPEQAGKFVRVRVTASGGATGTVYSNAKKAVATEL